MLKKFLAAVFCAFMLLCTVAFAAELKAGDTAYVVYNGAVSVTQYAAYSGNIAEVNRGAKVTVLEPYVIGEDNRKFHKIQLSDGTVGYILAYTTARETTPILDAGEAAEEELNKQWASSDTDKYQHAIEMTFLSDYIYGGSKTTEGKERNFYAKVPTGLRLSVRLKRVRQSTLSRWTMTGKIQKSGLTQKNVTFRQAILMI